MPNKTDDPNFRGFRQPKSNYTKVPNDFFDILPDVKSMAEIKIVLYVLKHTWGFSEYGKPKLMTQDEIMRGRKRKNGKRMDRGTGLSEQSVRNGVDAAIEHHFLELTIDDTDKGRIKQFYSLKMYTPEVKELDPDPQELGPSLGKTGLRVRPRSEKDTLGRHSKKEIHTDLIKSWLDTQGSKNAGAYKNVDIQASAKDLFAGGITPDDVSAYITAKRSQDFWKDKFVSFEHVANEIVQWKEQRAAPANGNGSTPRKYSVQQQVAIEQAAAHYGITVEEYLANVEAMQK